MFYANVFISQNRLTCEFNCILTFSRLRRFAFELGLVQYLSLNKSIYFHFWKRDLSQLGREWFFKTLAVCRFRTIRICASHLEIIGFGLRFFIIGFRSYESKANVTCPVLLTYFYRMSQTRPFTFVSRAGSEDYIYRKIWANRKQRNILNG